MTDSELIEAVAVEVMGGKKDLSTFESRLWFDELFNYWRWEDDKFDPLTNANHWMMVVEKMVKNDFMCDLAVWPDIMFDDDEDKDSWRVIFSKEKIWHNKHKSIGHAVCLAALEAVRGSK